MAFKEEVREKRIFNTVCVALCISMVGGFIYYVKSKPPIPQEKRIVNMEETVDPNYQKILDNIKVTPTEEAFLNANTIKDTIDNTTNNVKKGVGSFIDGVVKSISNKNADTSLSGFDKNGNPYLKKGASYTFKPDGTPVEAPADGNFTKITSPINGKVYCYGNFNHEWYEYTLDDIKKRSKAEAMGLINAAGETDLRKLTEEEIKSVGKLSVNVGTIGYK